MWFAYIISVILVILLMTLIQRRDRDLPIGKRYLQLLGRNTMYATSIASNHGDKSTILQKKKQMAFFNNKNFISFDMVWHDLKWPGNNSYTMPRNSPKLMFALRILLGAWLLMMIVLVNAYAGVMTALLTVPKMEPIAVNSLEELAASNKLKLTVAVNTIPANTFLVIFISLSLIAI